MRLHWLLKPIVASSSCYTKKKNFSLGSLGRILVFCILYLPQVSLGRILGLLGSSTKGELVANMTVPSPKPTESPSPFLGHQTAGRELLCITAVWCRWHKDGGDISTLASHPKRQNRGGCQQVNTPISPHQIQAEVRVGYGRHQEGGVLNPGGTVCLISYHTAARMNGTMVHRTSA